MKTWLGIGIGTMVVPSIRPRLQDHMGNDSFFDKWEKLGTRNHMFPCHFF